MVNRSTSKSKNTESLAIIVKDEKGKYIVYLKRSDRPDVDHLIHKMQLVVCLNKK